MAGADDTQLFSVAGKTFEPWCVAPGEAPVVPLFEYGESMTKVASSLDEVPRLKQYVERARPVRDGYTLLIHANGSDEVWGANRKGDSFPLRWLVGNSDYGYRTFETLANGYVHHRNQPQKWVGRVLMAEFNKALQRVELIVNFFKKRLIEEEAPYFIDMIERGELPATSMGCRVPYDICSICGNKAPSPQYYCDHIRFQRNQILSDGRRVRMLNYRPKFHDISLVLKPADPASRALLKVAEFSESGKSGDIEKRVPLHTVGALRKLRGRGEYEALVSSKADPDISLRTLIRLAGANKIAAYSALTGAGIILKPHEFAAMEYWRSGNRDAAVSVYEKRGEFPVHETRQAMPWTSDCDAYINDVVELMDSRSLYIPVLDARLKTQTKTAAAAEVVDVDPDIISAYSSYRKMAEDALIGGNALDWAYNRHRICQRGLGGGISILVKAAALDSPRPVFEAFVRAAYLPNFQTRRSGK